MRIRSRLLTKLVAWLVCTLVRLLFCTCRSELRGDVPNTHPYCPPGSSRYLFSLWHDQLLLTVFARQTYQIACLVSRHQDASYLAEAMKILGIRPVRGSTRRSGARALRELIRVTQDLHVGITPDGPCGPRRKMKPGIIFLASQTGRAIVPTATVCKRSWSFEGRWTNMTVPKPFTTIYLRTGTPVEIPRGLSSDEFPAYARKLEAEMERLEQEMLATAAGNEWPQPISRKAA